MNTLKNDALYMAMKLYRTLKIIQFVIMITTSVILCCALPVILGVPLTEEDRSVLNEGLDIVLDEYAEFSKNHVLTPQELAEQAGYIAETHEIVTEDRYVLQMHRITGRRGNPVSDKKPVVLLFHGLLDSSASWIFPGPGKGLALILADWGYDVWMGNSRGNRYCRKHLDWTVSDPEFWQFSWHEIGIYDIPAMIDYILDKAKQEKIFYISHSQGSTSFFVMASERPEYQKKLVASFNLAPAVFMTRSKNFVARLLAPHANNIKAVTDLIGMHEFKPSGKLIQILAKEICREDALLQPVCKNIIFLMDGFNNNELNMTLLPIITQYDPAGASTGQFMHYAQLMNSSKFQQYDHGLAGNLKRYRSIHPPSYKLEDVKMPVYLHYSNNDLMVDVQDLRRLYKLLPNAQALMVPYDTFTHLDFLWGKHANVWVYNKILSLMDRHRRADSI